MGLVETPNEDQEPKQSLPDRVALAGYAGFALLLAGILCGGMNGIALATLGTLTIVLSALFVAYLFATKHPATGREG